VKAVIPMHFGTFPLLTGTPEALRAKIKGSATKVWDLKAGVTVEW